MSDLGHVIRLYAPGSSVVDPVRRGLVESGASLAAPGTAGADLPGEQTGGATAALDSALLLGGDHLDLTPTEIVLFKHRWSAFFRTDLDGWLREQGVDTVVVEGWNLPICPRATLFDATERDYRAAVVRDAVSQTRPERLRDLELIGVTSISTSDAIAAMGELPHSAE